MARLVKCPRCQSQIDVTVVKGGTTLKCPDCEANVRLPTGDTSAQLKAPAAVAAPPQTTANRRSSPLFAKMAHAKSPGHAPQHTAVRRTTSRSNNPILVIGAIIAACALIGLLIYLVATKDTKKPNTQLASPTPPDLPVYDPTSQAEALTKPSTPPPSPKKGPSLQKKESGRYEAPATWEGDVKKWISPDATPLPVDPQVAQEATDLMKTGDAKTIADKADRYLPAVLNALVSEEEALARAAFTTLRRFCDIKGLLTKDTGKNPVDLDLINSAYYRAQSFAFWVMEWWPKNQAALGATQVIHAPIDAAAADWERIMRDLRAGGAFDDETRPEGIAMNLIKRMDRRRVYEKLVSFIEHEDIMIGRAACTALAHLSGHQETLPNESNKTLIKTRWQEWLSKN